MFKLLAAIVYNRYDRLTIQCIRSSDVQKEEDGYCKVQDGSHARLLVLVVVVVAVG